MEEAQGVVVLQKINNMLEMLSTGVPGKNVPFRHIEAGYRVSASPLTMPFKGGVGGTALHPPPPKDVLSGARGASYRAFSRSLPPCNRSLRSP